MDLGEKLRQARLEAGLSQRKLCEGIITRNMLSLIEHGTARPSMDTLMQLSARLGKSVSFFLEEEAVMSPNQPVMAAARRFFDAGDYASAARVLEDYQTPDPVYDRELGLLATLTDLYLAEAAIEDRRHPYARELLARSQRECVYCREDLDRKRLLLWGRLPGERVSEQLPSLDGELLLRAREAYAAGDRERTDCLLAAAQDRALPQWNLLRGRRLLEGQAYREAAEHLHRAEEQYPRETIPLLEQCYRELEEYKLAYEYACKQK